MGRPDSQDLRERVVDAAGATSRRQAAKHFGWVLRTAIRFMTALANDPDGGGPRKVGHNAAASSIRTRRFLRALIAERDDVTLEEMQARLKDDTTERLGCARRGVS